MTRRARIEPEAAAELEEAALLVRESPGRSRLRAILDYQRALIEFDRTQRASLGAAGIAMVSGAMGGGAGVPAGGTPPAMSQTADSRYQR